MPEQPQATVFRYESAAVPDGRGKQFQLLCRSDLLIGAVQRVRDGGETNLHSHAYLDGFWFVLRGRARFYTTGDEVLADLGTHEGVLIPRDYPYWFESTGDEDLELLQVEASSRLARSLEDFVDGRTDHAPRSEEARRAEAEAVGEGDG